MSMVIDGTNGLTFNNATTQNSGGKVLQVVNATLSSSQSTTSTSFVTTNLTASITPLFSNSKILMLATGSWYYNTGSGGGFFTFFRNSTNLEITSTRGFLELNIPTATMGNALAMSYVDSPATTSATTYSVYWRVAGTNPLIFCVDGSTATLTLMEIAA